MEQNKTRSYLLYALGEILLVVLGILIALQINNWNEYRMERETEQALLTQLYSEYSSNLEQLDEKIELREDVIHASLRLIHYIDHPEELKEDSMYVYIGVSFISPTFDPIINDIISSGRIDLIQNDELREKLTRWTSDVIQVTEEEDYWSDYKLTHYSQTIGEYGLWRNITKQYWQAGVLTSFQLDRQTDTLPEFGDSSGRPDFQKLLSDPVFEGHLMMSLTFAKLTNSQSYSLRNRIVDMLELMQAEINEPVDNK